MALDLRSVGRGFKSCSGQRCVTTLGKHRRKLRHKSRGLMASAERQAITGVQGQSPWSGGQGAKPPEAESILSFTSANGAQICQFLLPCKLLKYAF